MSQKCRVWWPKELASSKSSKSSSSSSSLLLFGWFVSCSPYCLDVVVAFAYDEAFLSHHSDSAIEEAIHYANVGMPTTLQDKYRFAILGCMLTCENTDNMCELHMVDRDPIQALKNAEALSLNSRSSTVSNCRKSISSLYSSRTRWMLVENGAHSHFTKENCQVPTVHHLHWNGKIFSEAELHVCYRL
uniref:Uncharacterized protein n=1 Tax=Opuntia streptacantha TaxID=393608 RepID=A0A7C9EUU3_OPUST